MAKTPIKPQNTVAKGALIAIPVDKERYALSQVYYPGVVFYLAVYDGIFDLRDIYNAKSQNIIIASWTNDAEIHRGNWIIVGNAPVEISIPEPVYKVIVKGKMLVESFDGRIIREATTKDSILNNRKSRSPLVLSDAIRAFHGLEEWSPRYDDMLIAH
jgi:hypothetical protein